RNSRPNRHIPRALLARSDRLAEMHRSATPATAMKEEAASSINLRSPSRILALPPDGWSDGPALAKPMWRPPNLEYATCEYYLAAAQLMLVTIGLGVTLRPRDFGQVLRAPLSLGLVFVIQLVLTPPLALALNWVFRLPPGFA